MDGFKLEVGGKCISARFLHTTTSNRDVIISHELNFEDEKFSEQITGFKRKNYFKPMVYPMESEVYLIFVKKISTTNVKKGPNFFFVRIKIKGKQENIFKVCFSDKNAENCTSLTSLRKNLKAKKAKSLSQAEMFQYFARNLVAFEDDLWELKRDKGGVDGQQKDRYLFNQHLVATDPKKPTIKSVDFVGKIKDKLSKTFNRLENKKNFEEMVKELLALGPEMIDFL